MSEQNHTSRSGDPAYANLLAAVKQVLDLQLSIIYAEAVPGGNSAALRLDLYNALERLAVAYGNTAVGVGDG